MIRSFGASVAVVALIALSGCTAPPLQPDPTPTFENHAPVEIPKGVVATGLLTASTGVALGTVTISHTAQGFEYAFPDLSSLGDPVAIYVGLADSPVSADACGDANAWQLGFMMTDLKAGNGFSDVYRGPYSDPSFFTRLLLVTPGVPPDAKGCIQPILARAPLTWDVPVTHPWIHVADSGPTAGAQGKTSERDGRLLYTTASGDVWAAIADRFGIGSTDLEFINPIRTPGEPHTAFEGQILNLDPTNRSDSESRRPH